MAETPPQIVSSKKEKDPRRVEAGRRLALISKQAKEKKRIEREMEGTKSWAISPQSGGLMLALTTAGVVAAVATLWYTRKDYQARVVHKGDHKEDHSMDRKVEGEYELDNL